LSDLTDLPTVAGLAVLEVDGTPRLAAWDGAHFRDAMALGPTFDEALALTDDDIRRGIEAATQSPAIERWDSIRPPIGSQEVWAAGVTYRRSEEARMEESATADVYARVYRATRPELFFKSVAWRVVGPGDFVGIRADSSWDVPEPELALLVGPNGSIRGFACGNDMSSRSIEGENPLYLPQAKVYDRSCALGPVFVPHWTTDIAIADVQLTITRAEREVFAGSTRVAEIVRPFEELAEYLTRAYTLPSGAWLLTGTGIVPSSDFTLHVGDEVAVRITGLGTLRNQVSEIGNH
jgi:2-dehydro-3-deoxy-D-arabinonate dehydratase